MVVSQLSYNTMKRGRDEVEVESFNDVANVLMLLSQGGGGGDACREESERSATSGTSASSGKVFECKTCNRQFQSFQALGGHRASHKKPRLVGDGQGQAQSGAAKPRVHECSICGLEFAIGQALGGHMRRHRAVAEGLGHGLVEKKVGDERRVELFDLNLPPAEEVIKCRKRIFGVELVDKIRMVDCFQ